MKNQENQITLEENLQIEEQPEEMDLISLKSIETTIDKMEELKNQIQPHINLEENIEEPLDLTFSNALAALAIYEKASKIQTEAIAKYVAIKNSNISKQKMELTKEIMSRKTKTITITEEQSIPKKKLKSTNLEDILDDMED